MRDLPNGPALLALARDVLLSDVLPLLPEDRRLDARLVANAMAIAEREAVAGAAAEQAIGRELAALYRDSPLPNPPPPAGEEIERAVPPPAGRGGAGVAAPQLLRRLAQDLRRGGFDGAPERERRARAILWRLTLARLRAANPRFLAANGFS